MDFVTVGIGIAALTYGAYTLYARRSNPGAFGKMEAMKRMWGEKAGLAMHFVAYSILPIVFGIVAIIAGLRGVSLLSW